MTIKRLFQEAERLLSEAGLVGVKVSPPKSPEFGEAFTPYPFEEARRSGGNPLSLAESIVSRLGRGEFIGHVEAAPPGFINFHADWARFSAYTVREVLRLGPREYGGSREGEGRVVLVEHTSVNPNKALHIGHARNVYLGDTIARTLAKTGYQVYVLNYIDDSGAQMASVLLGFLELGMPAEPPLGVRFDEYCGDQVYVEVSRRVEADRRLEERLRALAKKIEERESSEFKYARLVSDKVLSNQLLTCWRLGARYDLLFRESDVVVSGLWSKTFNILQGRGIVYLAAEGPNRGCWCVDLSSHPVLSKEGDEILVKSDGSTTYVARDIAFALWKLRDSDVEIRGREWGVNPDGTPIIITETETGAPIVFPRPEKVITVVGSEQRRPQEVIRYVLTKLGVNGGRYLHYSYERVSLSPDSARRLGVESAEARAVQMSGRRGIYIKADEVLDELKRLAAEEVRRRHSDWPAGKVDETSEAIARGALRYSILRSEADKAVVFDLREATRLEGDTGPYIQYSVARSYRILEKAADAGLKAKPTPHGPLTSEEKMLVRSISFLPLTIEMAAKSLRLRQLVTHSRELAVNFNEFYEKCPVIDGGEHAQFRLALVEAYIVAQTSLMELIGIPVLREM
ncbi:MAG: arginine--tRNA ligase [Nitrososphaerota archaeon]|nr:arginine--tRNA ligase [Candidatus Calditenuaceae archaeon]MDW8072667.1 arginine--tRNA ligase [Nitrososphaerota archaeon]